MGSFFKKVARVVVPIAASVIGGPIAGTLASAAVGALTAEKPKVPEIRLPPSVSSGADAGSAERVSRAGAVGRAATILTSPQGLKEDDTKIKKKTLLGE